MRSVLPLITNLLILGAVATACGSDDAAQQQQAAAEAEKRRQAAAAGTEFVPAEPPPQLGLPPGAGPYNGPPRNPDMPDPPKPDSGTQPTVDAGDDAA